MYQSIFSRVEKKYLLDEEKYNLFMKKISKNIVRDKNYHSTICNLYLDTANFDLIKQSIQKPLYREKFRIRSYNVPNLDDSIFFEVKKKYNQVVSKRRIKVKLSSVSDYLYNKKKIDNVENEQILNELEYSVDKYKLIPKVYIAYERDSYEGAFDKNVRITFDSNLRFRQEDLDLENGCAGKLYFDKPTYIMEIKTLGGMPIWLTSVLSQLEIFPSSFSKYGNIYKKYLVKKEIVSNV